MGVAGACGWCRCACAGIPSVLGRLGHGSAGVWRLGWCARIRRLRRRAHRGTSHAPWRRAHRRRWATRGGASAEALRLAWLRVPVQTLSGRTSSGTSQWRAAYASRRASHGRTHLSRRCAHAHGRAHRRRRCEGRRNHTGGARSRWTSNFRRTSHLRRTSQRRPARALRTSHLRGTWHRYATRWPSRCASDAHARHLRVERRDAAGCLLHGGPDCGPPGAWYGCWNPCGAPAICGGPLICGRPPLVCGVPPMFGGPALGIMGLGAKCGGAPPAKPVCFREVDRVRSRWGRAVGQIRQATEMCAHVRCPLVVEGFLGRMMFAHMGLGRSNTSPNGE